MDDCRTQGVVEGKWKYEHFFLIHMHITIRNMLIFTIMNLIRQSRLRNVFIFTIRCLLSQLKSSLL